MIGKTMTYHQPQSEERRAHFAAHAGESADRLASTRGRKVLFVGGSRNQTTQVHEVARQLSEVDAWFSPHFASGFEDWLRRLRLAEFTVIGQKHVDRCLQYLTEHHLQIDYRGTRNDYDLIVTSSDLVVPRNIRDKPIVLIQEGITDPETWIYRLVTSTPLLPRWLAGTATNGLSHQYSVFCVASQGYRDLFVGKGVRPERVRVTGIPNFDNCRRFCDNDFPHHGYVLVCTSDLREKYRREDRAGLIRKALEIAGGRQLIFKLHPNENASRATREIMERAPDALVFTSGSAEEMIANCDVFITRYSSTVYVALALGKQVYCDLDVPQLKRLLPDQHGQAARNVAEVVRELLATPERTNRAGREV